MAQDADSDSEARDSRTQWQSVAARNSEATVRLRVTGRVGDELDNDGTGGTARDDGLRERGSLSWGIMSELTRRKGGRCAAELGPASPRAVGEPILGPWDTNRGLGSCRGWDHQDGGMRLRSQGRDGPGEHEGTWARLKLEWPRKSRGTVWKKRGALSRGRAERVTRST